MSKNRVSILTAFKTIIWPRRGLVFVGLLLIVISRAASFVAPASTKVFIDEVLKFNDLDLLKKLVLLVILAIIVQSITSFLLTKLLSVQAQFLISELRAQVQKKVLSLPINYFDNTKSGELVSRIMTDVEGVRNLIGTGLVQLVGGTITAIAAFFYLLNISVPMTLFTLIPMILFALIALRAFKIIRPVFRERGKINAEVTGRLTETLGGIRVIKGFNAEQPEAKIFEEGVDRLFQNIKRSLTWTAGMQSAGTFLIGTATTGVLGLGGYYAIEGTISAGQAIEFVTVLALMVAPILQMSNIGSQLTEALAGLDRTEELMNTESEADEADRILIFDQIKGLVRFKDVHFSYDEGKEVLHGINFEVKPGEVVALVGSSGSGKTTIASLAASFLQPDSGQVLVDGKDLSKANLESYRQHLGVVLQDDFLFEGTIRENILFPRPDASEEELQAAVLAAYVNEFTDRFDDGLDTLIGERGVKLSGGQRQRLAIARAVLANPRILILDEATSNLDTESETLIQKSLAELTKGRTTFVIAHRLSTIRSADHILVIEGGNIAERGTHDELIAMEGRYYNLFTYQARI